MNPQKLGRACLPVILLATLTVPVWALTDEEVFKDFRFNFSNPGARALGLGGAFIAAADDATAAQANPAALHYVDRYEFFAEYRSVEGNLEIMRESTGSLDDLSGTSPYLDLQTVSNRADSDFLSFASFVMPFRVANHRARVAVSRQTVLSVDNSLQTDDGSEITQLTFSAADYPPWVNPDTGDIERYTVENIVNGDLDAEIVHYNLGLEYSLAKDFSIGITATYATLDMTSELVSETDDPRGILVSVNPRIVTGTGDFLPLLDRATINGTDNAWTYTVGVHWHPDEAIPTPSGLSPVRFGFVYRKGAELGVDEVFEQCSLDPVTNQSTNCTSETARNVIKVPDRFGFGASYHTPRHWVLALEAERIKYSDLLMDYEAGRNFFTNGRLQTPGATIDPTQLKYAVDDATVFRGGAEFRSQTRGGWGYALRAGYYLAPDNRIRLEEVNSGDAQVDALYKKVFGAGEDQDHFTAGFTLNVKGGFAVQAAGDFSDEGNQYLLSGIYRFGKSR